MGDEKARIGFPRAFSSPIPVLFPFHPIHSLPSPSIRSRGLRPLASSSWPTACPLDHAGQKSPQRRLCPEKFYTCIHLVGGTSNVRMAVASEWLAGPGPARSFFRSPALGLLAAPALPRGSLCCARRGRRTCQAVQIRSGSHLAAQSLCVCVCVCVSVRACVCARVCSRLPSHTNAGPRTQFSLSMATVTHSFGDRPTPERAAPAKREQPWLRGSRPGRKREPPRPRGSGPG